MVLSHSGEWNAGRDFIMSQSDREGREAIQTALNELTALGYRTVVKAQNEDGTFQTYTQWSHAPTEERSTDAPETRPSEKPTVLRTPSLRTPIENTKKTLSSDDRGFSAFWAAYPRKEAKQAARIEWVRLMDDFIADEETIIIGANRLANDPNREPKFTPLPAKWLREQRWEDDPLPPRQQSKQTRVSKFEELARTFATSDRLEIEQ